MAKSGYEHEVRLKVVQRLSDEEAELWLDCVIDHTAVGTVEPSFDEEDVEGVFRHEVLMLFDGREDVWIYAVPLTRDIDVGEGKVLMQQWAELYDDDFEITSSVEPVCPSEFGDYDEVEVDENYATEFLRTADEYKHNEWIRGMVDQGWRFGVTECAEDKFSPLMKPWHELTADQQGRMRKKFLGNLVNKARR